MYRLVLALLLCGVIQPASALDDPMRPPGDIAAKRPSTNVVRFVLESTKIAQDHRSALINGRTTHIGDTVDGARVIAIEPGTVRLQYQGQQLILQLLPLMVKQAPAIE